MKANAPLRSSENGLVRTSQLVFTNMPSMSALAIYHSSRFTRFVKFSGLPNSPTLKIMNRQAYYLWFR
jgi:hypothetical protein